MVVLVTCKNEEDLIKQEGAGVLTTLSIDFSDAQWQITPQPIRIWPNFELIRTLMIVLINCKNEEDPNKNEGARVLTTFSPL